MTGEQKQRFHTLEDDNLNASAKDAFVDLRLRDLFLFIGQIFIVFFKEVLASLPAGERALIGMHTYTLSVAAMILFGRGGQYDNRQDFGANKHLRRVELSFYRKTYHLLFDDLSFLLSPFSLIPLYHAFARKMRKIPLTMQEQRTRSGRLLHTLSGAIDNFVKRRERLAEQWIDCVGTFW